MDSVITSGISVRLLTILTAVFLNPSGETAILLLAMHYYLLPDSHVPTNDMTDVARSKLTLPIAMSPRVCLYLTQNALTTLVCVMQ